MGRHFVMEKKPSTETMFKPYNDRDNMYPSSSGSDSDESNASLLERSNLLNNKFMLPKDLCDNGNIFNELFSHSLWDGLPNATQQKLAEYLPVASDDVSSATKVVHSLFSGELHRFYKEPMNNFRQKLSTGNFRLDIARLQQNLAKSTTKDRRMVELQRLGRLAQNVMISREAALFSELQSLNKHALPSCGRVMDTNRQPRQWNYDFEVSSVMVKCQAAATKRYLSEIVSISEEAGISLSLSDEEDCIHALPTAPVRKQRRMLGSNSQSGEQPCHPTRPSGHSNPGCASGFAHVISKKSAMISNSNGTGGNSFDGTIFNAPKLFIVSEDHYKKLLVQHRKRKIEEPDHPELNLDGVKLKDVVSRTQIAAGYRRILPLPKVYISESTKENTIGIKARIKSQKPFRMHRPSTDLYDQDELKHSFDLKLSEQNIDTTKIKAEPMGETNVKPKDEQPDNSFESRSTDHAFHDLNLKHEVSTEGMNAVSNNDTLKESTGKSNWSVEKKQSASEFALEEKELSVIPAASTSLAVKGLINVDQSESLGKASETNIVDQHLMNLLLSNGTHACFLSVVRDLFCSNPDHRSTMPELQLKLEAWTNSSGAERNGWFKLYRNNGDWNATLQSAVQFLAGEFQNQPEDFVPYIEHKVAINILQWIGASRDADSRLVPLCAYWQSRMQEINKTSHTHTLTMSNISGTNNSCSNEAVTALPKNKSKTIVGSKNLPSTACYSPSSSLSTLPAAGEVSALCNESNTSSLSATTVATDEDGSTSERSVTPPPPLFPTDWCVRKATDEEIQSFREQEKRRYENPHMAFTYKQHSYDSVVGPVKGIYTQAPGISKARGHSMLVANRPNFVTILTLVRDATARLPNGEGTRADICELLKSSQYISPTATDQILQTIVSGALDRMHTEHDPCVKYDAKRKIWIYLHRNRTEQEFERLHMQYQGFSKHKKSIVRKPMRQSRENILTSSPNPAKQHLLNDSGLSSENVATTNSVSEVDQDSSPIASNVIDSAIIPSAAITVVDISTTTTGGTMSGARSTTSLLKKQASLASMDNIVAQQLTKDTRNENSSASNSPSLTDRAFKSIGNLHDTQIMSSESVTDTSYKSLSKVCSAVTLIASSGNNVRTIQIPKSSLPSNRPVAPNTSTIGNEVSTTFDLLTRDPSPQSPKKIFVSAVLSSTKSTIATTTLSPSVGTTSNPVTDNLRKTNSKPILVQSAGTATPILTSPACSFSKDGIKIGSTIGGTILSIRQVNNTNIGTLGQKNQTFTCGQSSSSLLSPQVSTQAKGTHLSINSASSMLTPAPVGNAIQTIKGSSVITAAIEKPIYSSSVGSSTLKQSSNSTSVLQSNSSATVLSQKMMLSSARTYASSSGESSSVPTIVAIKPASSTNLTTVTATTTNRIIKPTANLFSTITLAKGQQSLLTPAKQRQIIQNLLTQNQKQALTTKQIVSPTTVLGPGASSISKGPIGDVNPSAGSSTFLLDGQTAVPAFKIQHNVTSNMKTLSPQIVKITPTRAKTHSISTIRPISTIVASSNSPVLSSSSIVNQASPGVKMIQMHPSTILTSTEAQGILNASTMCTANTVTISGANNVGSSTTAQNATMRVLKTATGTTTVIKTEVTASAAPVQQLSQGIRHQLLDKHRKESSAQVGSKVIVTPNISTGQLIPLESLLQKQGVTATANNSPGGVNTFLKITGTNKTGQQFLQFTTSSNAATSGSSTSASNVSSNSGTPIGSVGHQYTIVPQARNIISVASAAGTGRQTKLPLTIVSSSEQNDTFQSAASIIVANKKANVSEVNATGDSGTSLVTQMTNSPVGKQVPQGTKVKLLATTQSPKSFSSGPIASSTTIQPQNTVFNTKTSPAPTDLLNAKIIGVRNIASTKLKGTSSLSLMNAGGLNIAHIGGKPVIIANNSAIGTNHLHNNSVNKGTPAGTMLLTANTNSNNLVLGQQNSNAASLSGLPSTARRESACTNIANGIPGQIQTVMIRNNLLKVQSVPSTTANKLSHHKTIAAGSGGNSGTTSGINTSTSTIIASAGRSTQLHQQPHDAQVQYSQQNTQKHQQIISSGGTAVILTPNIPTSNAQLNTTGADEKPFVRLHSSDIANNSDGGPQRTQSQRIVLSQPIMIPADVNKSGNAFNFKRVKVIPISKQPKK